MRKKKVIREYKESLEELKKNLPKRYHPYEGVTEIHYGFMGRKTIKAEELE